MSIVDSINTARQRNVSDDAILSEITKQNPSKKTSFDTARQRGADSTSILNEVIKQNSNKPESLGQKALGVASGVGKGLLSTAVETGRLLTYDFPKQVVGRAVAGVLPGVTYQDISNKIDTEGYKGTPLEALQRGTPMAEKLDEFLKAKTSSEKVGKVGEFIAESVVPIGKIGQTKTVLKSLTGLSRKLVDIATGRTGVGLRSDLRKEFPIIGEQLSTFADRYLKEWKFFATPKQGIKVSTDILRKTGTALNKLAEGEVGKRSVQIGDLLPSFQANIKKLFNVIPDSPEKTNLMSKIVTESPQMAWKEARELLINAKKILPKSAFTGESKLSAANQNLQRILDTLSNRLTDVAEGTEYNKLQNTYGLFREVRDQLIKSSTSDTGLLGKLVGSSKIGIAKSLIPAPAIELPAAKALDTIKNLFEKSKKIF